MRCSKFLRCYSNDRWCSMTSTLVMRCLRGKLIHSVDSPFLRHQNQSASKRRSGTRVDRTTGRLRLGGDVFHWDFHMTSSLYRRQNTTQNSRVDWFRLARSILSCRTNSSAKLARGTMLMNAAFRSIASYKCRGCWSQEKERQQSDW